MELERKIIVVTTINCYQVFKKLKLLGYKSNKNIVNEDKNYIFSYIHYTQIYQ